MLNRCLFPRTKNKKSPFIYLDNAASSIRGSYLIHLFLDSFGRSRSISEKAELLKFAESRIAALLGIEDNCPSRISFVPNATYGINQIAYFYTKTRSWTRPSRIERQIYLSDSEHASNHLIWLKLSDRPIKYLQIKKFSRWQLPTEPSIFAFTSDTNLEGIHISIDEISRRFLNSKHVCIVDASQLFQHEVPKLKESLIDHLVFTAHKFFGPNGLGVVYSRDCLPIGINSSNHLLFDGGYDMDLDALESWASSLDIVEELFESGFAERQNLRLRRHFELNFPEDNGYVDWINRESKSLIFLLRIRDKDISAHDYAFYLGRKGVIVRAGLSCSWLSGKKFEGGKILRISLGMFNSCEELDRFFRLIREFSILDCL